MLNKIEKLYLKSKFRKLGYSELMEHLMQLDDERAIYYIAYIDSLNANYINKRALKKIKKERKK